MKFVFSPDIILCDCLGSKYKLKLPTVTVIFAEPYTFPSRSDLLKESLVHTALEKPQSAPSASHECRYSLSLVSRQ